MQRYSVAQHKQCLSLSGSGDHHWPRVGYLRQEQVLSAMWAYDIEIGIVGEPSGRNLFCMVVFLANV